MKADKRTGRARHSLLLRSSLGHAGCHEARGCGILTGGGPPFAALRTGLGPTSVVLNQAGTQVVAESRHHPYGVERWRRGTFPTDYRYTGQRQEEGLGLYRMGARWYDPGRWPRPPSASSLLPVAIRFSSAQAWGMQVAMKQGGVV